MDKTLPKVKTGRTLQPINSVCKWKVGLDVGTSATAFQEISGAGWKTKKPRGSILPTAFKLTPNGESEPQHDDAGAGESTPKKAKPELVYPFQAETSRLRSQALLAFAGSLRQKVFSRETEKPWGVVSRPTHCDVSQELRTVANTIFERVIFVNEPRLMTMGFFHWLDLEYALVVDLGASGTRLYLLTKYAPIQDAHVFKPFGGRHVDAAMLEATQSLYSDLAISERAIARLKEQLGFVYPEQQPCTVRLRLGDVQRTLDFSDVVQPACEAVVNVVLTGVRELMSLCPSELAENFLSNIFLVGGGARLPGLPERIQTELRAEGAEVAHVKAFPANKSIVAIGALKWAVTIEDKYWGVPIFEYR